MHRRDLSSFVTQNHVDMPREQQFVDRILATVLKRQQVVGALTDANAGATHEVNEALRELYALRLADLADERPLIIGSFLGGPDGLQRYVGRRSLLDDSGEELLINWRARAAEPFLHARSSSSLGVTMRRRYQFNGRKIERLFDEYFDGRPPPQLSLEDELLSNLRRCKPGELCDILETIEAEQAAILEEELPGILIIDGGPGTGKTIVGLMRLALQLGREPRPEDAALLVVGPTRAHIRYISRVLPGLGEDDVAHSTIDDIPATNVRARAQDSRAVERIKADVRMAPLLAKALRAEVVPRTMAIPVPSFGTVHLSEADVADLVDNSIARPGYRLGREVFRSQLLAMLIARATSSGLVSSMGLAEIEEDIARQTPFRSAVNSVWPQFTAHHFLRGLLGSTRRLETVGDDFDKTELALLYRAHSATELAAVPWSSADLPLLDEIEHLLAGAVPQSYQHVVVDEAQDLTPMQLRMVARRCPSGSVTVLGDLTQATGPYTYDDWFAVTGHLSSQVSMPRLRRLRFGYRVPSVVAPVALSVLRRMNPGTDPPQFVGDGLGEVRKYAVPPHAVIREAASIAARMAVQDDAVAVGVIAPEDACSELLAQFAAKHISAGDARHGMIDQTITVLPPHMARGLEFTHVLIVRPGDIVAEDTAGYKRLYVAITRCCDFLGIVHSGEWDELVRPLSTPELRESALEKASELLRVLLTVNIQDCEFVLDRAARHAMLSLESHLDAALAALAALIDAPPSLRTALIQWLYERLEELGLDGQD
jgi:DNA helicase IV